MALTDTAIRAAKPRTRDYKLADGGGLYLLVTPAGGKLWRLKFRVDGKEKKLSLGAYPEISLGNARKERDKARENLMAGDDPALEKQREKRLRLASAGDTFDAIASEFSEKRKRDGDKPWAPATANKAEWLLAQLSPAIGKIRVTEIKPADLLAAVRLLERRGNLESARRALQLAGMVLRYAVATARLTSDPSRDLRGALTVPTVKSRAAIIEPKKFGELLRAIDGYEGRGSVKYALQLLPLLFCRPGELRLADWSEFDFEKMVWSVPAGRMKMRRPHHVPLSEQAVAILHEVQEISGRKEGYVFTASHTVTRPLSENTLNAALRRLGYSKDEVTAHGFRATASTLLNESGKWSADAIERALAHGDDDRIRGVYNRSAYWAERVKMGQWWANHLDMLRSGTYAMKRAAKA
jgi:integrase